ncbi:MAG TPA: FAD binding domain-containing protein [Micromonosporaceae bacterium]|nr:FAD binding domain-containing protein [Micromonosporaceae bacterium]
MKPPAFDYYRPASVAEAVKVLAELGPDAKVLAGGQSLVPLLNMRLAAPKALVDINRLDELAALTTSPTAVRVGALVRHSALLRDREAGAVLPLLGQATRHVAHETIRNRGTTVGSLVHADPAGEMPAVLLLCDGTVQVVSAEAERDVPAAQFFLGPLESAVRPGELAVSATFPVPPGRTGSAWVEVSRRAGDYALCGVGVFVTLTDDLTVESARAAYISVGPTPVLVDLTDAVGGAPHDAADWAAAGALAQGRVAAEDDIHATADYRRHLVGVLTERAGRAAVEHARERHG